MGPAKNVYKSPMFIAGGPGSQTTEDVKETIILGLTPALGRRPGTTCFTMLVPSKPIDLYSY